jgi:uncharacterized protein (TIGR02145 family)
MKKLLVFSLFGILLMLSTAGCKKDPELPLLETNDVSGIGVTSSVSGGNITSDGGAEVTARGVCWSNSANPSVSDFHTSDGVGIGSYTSNLTGLIADTKYYVRAFAVNKVGVGYGNEVEFTTNPIVGATLITAAVGTFTSTSATLGGEITDNGGADVTERGVCWGSTADPTTSDSHTPIGSGTGVFSQNIIGLTPGTTYHVRAYAINSVAVTYGNDVTFRTLAEKPAVNTATVTTFTQTTATMGGTVTTDGGDAVTERGVCWSTTASPTISGSYQAIGSGVGAFSAVVTGLTAGTTYFVRAYAINSIDIAYGDQITFSTRASSPPVLSTLPVTSITMTTAVSGGNITSTGGGTITSRGVCYATTENPDLSDFFTSNGTGAGNFTSPMSDLTAGTTYYVRAYATNSAGTSYGNQVEFTTNHEEGTVADVDGNVYRTVKIGNQWWMAENLRTTHYNNDAPITLEEDSDIWSGLDTPAYCWYFNDPDTYSSICGAIYNWYAGNTGILCPTGWHIPSDQEYKTLEMYLGMTQEEADDPYWRSFDVGTKMKAVTGWSLGGNGTNSSGFSGNPGGYRYWEDGEFYGQGTIGSWMTSSEYIDNSVFYRNLNSNFTGVWRNTISKSAGKSVRCVRNN